MPPVLTRSFLWLLLSLATLGAFARAETPYLINYKGVVAVDGVNFKGQGRFKFALVDSAGTTTFWSHDGSSIAGSEPTSAVTLTVTKGRYSVLLGDTTLANMSPVPDEVFAHTDLHLRIWFSGGVHGWQLLTPDHPIAAPTRATAVNPVPNSHGDQLRNGSPVEGWQQLGVVHTPPTARSSHTAVWTGSEMIAWGGYGAAGALNTGGRYDPVTNTWAMLPGTGAPAGRYDHTSVWTGSEMVVWGGHGHQSTTYLNDGGRYNPATNTWTPIATAGSPAARNLHTAVWTGNEMIVWGGGPGDTTPLNDGGRYNPASDSWTPLPTNGAPATGMPPAAVWTGTEMIVWNGNFGGGRYNPIANSWTPVATNGAPAGLSAPVAVWTGSEMIVWGSMGLVGFLGGRYDPVADTWAPVSSVGAPPAPRNGAVWTGTEMLIWGGTRADAYAKDVGGRYNPSSNTWTMMSNAGMPEGRAGHTAVWTGTEMIVWGGTRLDGIKVFLFNEGGRYNPTTDTWIPVRPTDAPKRRYSHTAVWTGREMIVWGGSDYSGSAKDAGRYDPALNKWTPVSLTGAPPSRGLHTAVWTGNEMIVWGGASGGARNDGGRYAPATDSWTAMSSAGAPTPRYYHTAVWTGGEMIVWGGGSNTGGRYNPLANTWSPTTTTAAPSARSSHTAVWTGSEMIVWGGSGGSLKNDGGRYNPSSDSWATVTASGTPAPREFHTAVWTGSEMIVWGGYFTYNTSANDGARYKPATDTWVALPATGAPSARRYHTAVWTGAEMIVWGGQYGDYPTAGVLASGGRYRPATNTWAAATGGPAGRLNHSAVWTGSAMIIFGGANAVVRQTYAPDVLNDAFCYSPGSEALRPAIVVEQAPQAALTNGGVQSFGETFLTSTRALSFTLKNIGLTRLMALAATIDGQNAADFAVISQPVGPVEGPEGNTSFVVRFSPSSEGPKTATLHITSNDPDDNPFDIHLSGSGLAPISQVVAQGAPASLSANAAAGASVQWLKDGVEIPGATNPTLMLSSVQPWQIGVYSVRVSAAGVVTLTDVAMLGLNNVPAELWRGLVACYPFDSSAQDLCRPGKPAVLVNTTELVTDAQRGGVVHVQGKGYIVPPLEGESPETRGPGGFLQIPRPPLIDGEPFTISLLIKEEGFSYWHGESLFTMGEATASVELLSHYWIGHDAENYGGPVGPIVSHTSDFVPNGSAVTFNNPAWTAFTITGEGTTLRYYRNGQLIGTSAYPKATAGNFFIGRHWWMDTQLVYSTRLIAKVDDLRIYNRALSAPEVQLLYTREQTTPPPGSFESWVLLHSLVGADAALDADRDRDGRTNWEEYCFGTSPTDGTQPLLQAAVAGTTLTLTWFERAGVSYTLRESSDFLNPWVTSATAPTLSADQTGVPAGYARKQVSISLPSPAAPGQSRFFRVEATKAP